MKGHLFEEHIEELYRLTDELFKMNDMRQKLGVGRIEGIDKIAFSLSGTIIDLEYDIEDYEEGIADDIDKTKKEILERLKRL